MSAHLIASNAGLCQTSALMHFSGALPRLATEPMCLLRGCDHKQSWLRPCCRPPLIAAGLRGVQRPGVRGQRLVWAAGCPAAAGRKRHRDAAAVLLGQPRCAQTCTYPIGLHIICTVCGMVFAARGGLLLDALQQQWGIDATKGQLLFFSGSPRVQKRTCHFLGNVAPEPMCTSQCSAPSHAALMWPATFSSSFATRPSGCSHQPCANSTTISHIVGRTASVTCLCPLDT